MNASVYNRIKSLIEETNGAFSECRGAVNADYAEFATMSLPDFKTALQDPRLSADNLIEMLRKGATEHRSEDPESCWATFMAHYVARAANKNLGHQPTPQSYDQIVNHQLYEEKA